MNYMDPETPITSDIAAEARGAASQGPHTGAAVTLEYQMGGKITSPIRRFLIKVNKCGPVCQSVGSRCWMWKSPSVRNGYGLFYNGEKLDCAHRFSYQHFVGEIPEDKEIDHLCRNRLCVNPRHLEAVSHRENCLRGTSPAAKNAKKTHCHNGHKFDEANTHRHPLGRKCRACDREKYRRSVGIVDQPQNCAHCGRRFGKIHASTSPRFCATKECSAARARLWRRNKNAQIQSC